MAFPLILIDAATGSDTQASGAGPASAIFGTTNASTDATGLIVTLPAGTVLTSVLTDGSHVLNLGDATAGARNFSAITATSGSGGATPTVTVANAFGLSLSSKSWAIGGKLASLGSTTSSKLAENNSLAGDAMPGWIVQGASGHTETRSATLNFRRPGDSTSGPVTLRGEPGAATPPVFTFSNNGTAFGTPTNPTSYIAFADFEVRNSNASKTASVAFTTGSNSDTILISGIRCNHATDRFWKFLTASGSGALHSIQGSTVTTVSNCIEWIGSTVFARDNRLTSTSGVGIILNGGTTAGVIADNEIVNCGGDGITRGAATTTAAPLEISDNTIYGNGGDGISIAHLPSSTRAIAATAIVNNIIANNAGYALDLTGAAMTATAWNAANSQVRGNATYSNTSGACNLSGIFRGGSILDPQFVNAAGGDFRIGVNVRGTGYPDAIRPGGAYRSLPDPGANQPSSGSAGSFPVIGSTFIRGIV